MKVSTVNIEIATKKMMMLKLLASGNEDLLLKEKRGHLFVLRDRSRI